MIKVNSLRSSEIPPPESFPPPLGEEASTPLEGGEAVGAQWRVSRILHYKTNSPLTFPKKPYTIDSI
jgi:hypothetical protein